MSPENLIPLFIGGSPVSGDNSLQFPVVSASTGKIVHYAQGANAAIAQKAAKAAENAFESWSSQDAQTKRILFNKAAKVKDQRRTK
jgi:acyl-CoA reductase-like NAD-dependent aldehyde dehydrogenase